MDLTSLNPKQLEAVHATEGAVLVLAGAGSGKTRVLTHRIGHLIEDKGVSPYNILAITFTNRATDEMRERLDAMLGDRASGVWVSTFHSLCARILRSHADKLGYDKNYTIYTDDDRTRVLKRIITNKHIEEKDFITKAEWHIGHAKMLMLSPEKYINECGDFHATMICEVYEAYEAELKSSNAMDYDDLMLKVHDLFTQFPEVLNQYATRFKYIHIDEYQDTSRLQYLLASMLASVHGNIFAVGDEDQSIYGWRGADISNILDFKKDFPDAVIVKLEQNYRSTPNILRAANALIANNKGRFDKELWTDSPAGVRVEIYNAGNDRDEAEYVSSQIAQMVRAGTATPSSFAILVRLNALSRKFEERLRLYNIPYKVFCGFKFFERTEVKDLLAYFRAVVNPRDNDALLRIINKPKRKIGDAVIGELILSMQQRGLSAADVLFSDMTECGISEKSAQKLNVFKELYFKLINASASMPLKDFAQYVVDETGFMLQFVGNDEEDVGHRENVNQLLAGINEFADENEGAGIDEYLQSVSLLSESDDIATDDYVTISSVHSVKGLEFDSVFVTGLEENVFPAQSHSKSSAEVEEERRVMYVAMTRARKRLYLTCAKERFVFGNTTYNLRSRFLNEVEDKIYPKQQVKPQSTYVASGRGFGVAGGAQFGGIGDVNKYIKSINGISADTSKSTSPMVDYKLGEKVEHPRYGVGRIIQLNGENASIAFDGLGIKQFNLRIAPLKRV